MFANSCDECGKPIGIDSKDLSYKDKHWHEHCFLCSMCKMSLVDKPFGSKNDRIFCANCYDQVCRMTFFRLISARRLPLSGLLARGRPQAAISGPLSGRLRLSAARPPDTPVLSPFLWQRNRIRALKGRQKKH